MTPLRPMQLTAETECWKTRTDTVLSCHHLTAFVSNGFYVFTFFWMENKPAKPKTAKKGMRNISNIQLHELLMDFLSTSNILSPSLSILQENFEIILIWLLQKHTVYLHLPTNSGLICIKKVGKHPNHHFSKVKFQVISRSKIIIMLNCFFFIK